MTCVRNLQAGCPVDERALPTLVSSMVQHVLTHHGPNILERLPFIIHCYVDDLPQINESINELLVSARIVEERYLGAAAQVIGIGAHREHFHIEAAPPLPGAALTLILKSPTTESDTDHAQ